MAEKPEIMTCKEVASLWRFEPQTVRRWVTMGRLKALRIGNHMRFRRADVIAAMERYEHGEPVERHGPRNPATRPRDASLG